MSGLWELIETATQSKKYLYVPLEQGAALEAERSYLRILIAEMFLEKQFAWFSTWYPAVSVSAKLDFGDQKGVTITRVASPPLGATMSGVLKNYPILDLIPFSGGTVRLQAALTAMQGTKVLSSAIDVLKEFSSLVGPPLGVALNVAEKVSNGLETMLNAANGQVRLPYSDTFEGSTMGKSQLKSGYLAIIRAEEGTGKDQVDSKQLSIHEGQLYYRQPAAPDPAPFRQADYVLLNVEGTDHRDDYWKLSSIEQAHKAFIKTLGQNDQAAIDTAEKAIRQAVYDSTDLALYDRRRVWEAIKQELEQEKKDFGLGAVGATPRKLDDILDTWGMTMNQAVKKGKLTIA